MTEWAIKQLGFSVFRLPYLPENTTDVLAQYDEHLDNKENNEASIRQSLRQLIKLSNNKNIVQAIEFASENLAAKIADLTDELTIENLKLAASIYKYLVRMSTRSTPFGAFSSVMTVTNKELAVMDISPEQRLYLRIDNACVLEIAKLAEVLAIESRNVNLKIRKNSSLYTIADEVRFVAKNTVNKLNDFKLDSVTFSQAIKQTLNMASDWITVANLVSKLTTIYPDVKISQLSDFVFDLIKNQLLESNLTIVVSSKNSFKALHQRLEAARLNHDISTKMAEILQLLDSISSLHDAHSNDNLKKAKQVLSLLLPDYEMKRWLHVDSFRSGQNFSMDVNKIQPLLKTINSMAQYFWQPNQLLEDFTKKFVECYGDAEVSLLEALDIDNGIPFGQTRGGSSPLLNGVIPHKHNHSKNTDWQPLDQFLIRRIIAAISNRDKIVQINSHEIDKYKIFLPKPKNCFDGSASIHGMILEGEDNEPLFQIKSVFGPSALMLLGRFCCGDDTLTTECRKIARQEKKNNPHAIFAEIVHVQQAITANVSCRPSLREYEIVYGPGDSGLSHDKQIKCEDLYLKAINGRLCLYSKKLKMEIKPRLASAHNTRGLNLPIYQFLHAMQGVDGWMTGMSLNTVFTTLPYIPEIRIDNLIISERRWLLNRSEMKILHEKNSIDNKLDALKNLKIDKAITRYVALSEGDNVLEFDLESPFSMLLFINEIKNKSLVTLCESVKGRTDKQFQHDGKVYRHEFIIPTYVQSTTELKPVINFNSQQLNIRALKNNTSLPGEKWKYLKIYTGEASADKLISKNIAPLAHKLIANNFIDSWFFIRYFDPDFHIRVRFKLKANFDIIELNKCLYKPLRVLYKQGLIKNISEESYVPEITRYGGTDILPVCERLFYLNSVIVTDVINNTLLHPDKNELRWKMCLHLAWKLALGASDSLQQMELFYKKIAASYDQEFGSTSTSKKKLSDNYRKSMQDVAACLKPDYYVSQNEKINTIIIPQYNEALNNLKSLCHINKNDVLTIIQSIIHMDCNRIFTINPRANEWIIYHYLARYSRTVIARDFKVGKEVVTGFG